MRSSFITTSGSKGFFVLLIVEKRTTYLLENKSESNARKKKTRVQQTDEKTGALHSDNHLGLVSKAAQKNVDVKLAWFRHTKLKLQTCSRESRSWNLCVTVSSLPTKRNVDDQLERYFLLEQKKKDQLKHKGKKSIVLYTKTLVRLLKSWFHFFFSNAWDKKKKAQFWGTFTSA